MGKVAKLVKVCSKCGSTNWFSDNRSNVGAVTNRIVCRYCRHEGWPLEVEKKAQEQMHKEFEKKYGKSASAKW